MPNSSPSGQAVSSAENNSNSNASHRNTFSHSNSASSITTVHTINNKLNSKSSTAQEPNIMESTSQLEKVLQQQRMTNLPSYPLIDTFSLLCILMIFPHWFGAISLILYIFLGNPEFLDSILSFILQHKLNKTSNSSSSVNNQSSSSLSIVGDIPFISFILYLLFDAVFMFGVFFLSPGIVPYIILLSKAFIASNLTSLKDRYIFDAFASSFLLLILENSALYAIKRFEIVRTDSILSLTSTLSSTDFLYPLYYPSSASVTKTLLFYLTFHRIRGNSLLMFRMEYALQFFHATLSLYVIMHNLNPILRRLSILNKIYLFLESFASKQHNNQQDSSNISIDFTNSNSYTNNFYRPKFQTVFHIPKEISGSKLPTLSSNIITVNESDTDNENSEVGNLSEDSLNTDTTKSDENNIPMWFPEDDQVVNMNDVTSSSFVVAQNFENFCRMIWTSSTHLLLSNTPSFPSSQDMTKSPSTNSTTSTSTSTNLPSTLSNSTSIGLKYKLGNSLANNSAKRIPSKYKNVVSTDKKTKLNTFKYQQPLWLFLIAARTMFSRQDYYSGDYYSHNAVVATGYGVDDYVRSQNGSSQCFIWFTGETTLAFELHNISLEQLLIKVNGIIWEHVSSCTFFGREMVIINGLSPLSQYDIDFVKITLSGELIHLTTTTVSTVFQNKTVTESNISSPLTTLQRSVVTTQEAIEREKARLKKLKSDWRKKSSQIKSEIENLNNRSNFSDESRNYKKLDSLRQTVAKSDIEVTNLSKKSEEARLLQTEIEEKYLDAKRLFETELRAFNKLENERTTSINHEEKKIKALMSEKNQLLLKKEKIISKKLRINHDVELLTNELQTLKKTEIALRVERRKFRSIQREEKYRLLVNDIKKIERQLKGKNINSF